MRTAVGAVCLVALMATSCRSVPVDAYEAGESAVLQNDLLGALQAFDAVPVAHPRYPEARAAAAGVERRMRRSHEILLEGLLLRSEWRDREALVALHRAQEIWPKLPGIEVLIHATEHRQQMFGEQSTSNGSVAVVVPAPAPAPEQPSGAGIDLAKPMPTVVVTPSATPAAPAGETAAVDLVAAGLVAVEAKLSHGEFEAAVADLFQLSSQNPDDVRVRLRLARVLHQRALLRYGQGALRAAISDWERVLTLDPGHAVARNLLEAARAEANSSGDQSIESPH